jgi:hypothetical protein
MGTMNEWNKLVDKNWDYWEYYRDLYDFALSKGANTIFTRFLYPVFYQERLLKREFVHNMQLLGELKSDEIKEYESLTRKPFLHRVYKYYSKPTGWYFGFAGGQLLLASVIYPVLAHTYKKSISWYVMSPLLFTGFGLMAINHMLKLNLPAVLDMTQWALEQRKAQAWAEEKKLQPLKIAPLPELRAQILGLVQAHKP